MVFLGHVLLVKSSWVNIFEKKMNDEHEEINTKEANEPTINQKENQRVEEKEEKEVAEPIKETYFEYFKTKKILFGPIEYTIITQNKNGPCPLIALTNALVLKGKIKIPCIGEIRHDDILSVISDVLLTPPNDEKAKITYEANLEDVISLMPSLIKGLDVNPKFSAITDFEFTPAVSLFDLLNVHLYHVWVPDPQLGELSNILHTLTYNTLVTKMCDENESMRELLSDFYADSQNQITFHGLSCLIEKMKDGDLAVLFRNNHFYTIFKRRDEIFTLVTDEGFVDVPDVVWESLSSVDGDSFFVNCEFRTYRPAENSMATTTPTKAETRCEVNKSSSSRSSSRNSFEKSEKSSTSPVESSKSAEKSKCILM